MSTTTTKTKHNVTTNPKLEIYMGPMFAGKTTNFINLIKKHLELVDNDNDKILVINHKYDTRYVEDETFAIATHDLYTFPANSLNKLSDIYKLKNFNIAEYIFIDEAQFFEDLYDEVKSLLFDYNKNIFITGLDGDFKQIPFTNSRMLELIPFASKVEKFVSKCYICNGDAPFTKRMVISDSKILIGGEDEYQPSCIKHL